MYYYWGEPEPWRETDGEREVRDEGNSGNDNHCSVCKRVLCTLLAFQYLKGSVWQEVIGN